MVDLGTRKYSDATLKLIQSTRFTSLNIDNRGDVVSYTPVGYAPGVVPPPEGAEIEYEVLNRYGQVVAWKACSPSPQ